MKYGIQRLAIFLILISPGYSVFGQGFGEDWQKPRKEPEVVREKEKPKPQKDEGRSKGREEPPKKKDGKKKPD